MSAESSKPADAAATGRTASAGIARELLERLCPDEDLLRSVSEILAESISKAHDINPACWSLGAEPERGSVHFHVGRVPALALELGEISVILLDDDLGTPTGLRDGAEGEESGTFKSLHDITWHRLGAVELLGEWSELRGAHLDAVERGAKQVSRTPYLASHTPGAVEALGEILDRSLPHPDHAVVEPDSGAGPEERLWRGLSGSRQREFRSLLGEFLDDVPVSSEGSRELELLRRGRESGRRSFEELLEAGERGRAIAETVLRRLLPHADTPANRHRGAWVTAGGRLPGDVLSWLEEIGAPGAEQGTPLAAALLDFVRCSVEDPASLPDVCRGFTALPYTRGLSAALVTPILNAVRPQEFLALDDRTRRVIDHFAGSSFTGELAGYPTANAVGRQLLSRLADELSIASDYDLLPCDLFAAFCHWLTAKIQHPLGTARYWRIAVAGSEWRRCREVGFVTLAGWREIGNLAGLEREELAGRGEDTEPLWTFAREIADGDRVVAVAGDRALGIGTVTGGYTFVAGGHRRPVEWDDTTLRWLPRGVPKGDAVELARTHFDAVREAAVVETVTPAAEQEGKEEGGAVITVSLQPFYTLDRLAADTGFDRPTLESWVRAIERKGQAILHGPPGTGKTHLARGLARHLVSGGDGLVELVPLHAGHTYETFFGAAAADDGGAPGLFAGFCRRAAQRQGRSVLILDEMHRADLPRLLGEAVYLLEQRGEEVPLAAGGRLAVPPTLVLLGTLSTAVPGAGGLDPVLSRRFAFLPVAPRWEVLRQHRGGSGFPVDRLIELLERLNEEIGDPRFAVGVTPFLAGDLEEVLPEVWTLEIEPYLEQHLEPEVLERYRWERVRGEVGL